MRVRVRAFSLLQLVSCVLLVWTAQGCTEGPGDGTPAGWPDPAAALFDDRALHDIRLRLAPADWRELLADYGSNIYYRGELGWRDGLLRDVAVRSRGSGSRNRHKPGLRIDFNRYARGQDFLGLSSLVLDNLYTDVSMLRERVAMKFLARMDLPAPRESSVRLFVNDEYIGLYAAVEPIDKRFLRRVDGLAPDGDLFEYRWTDKWLFAPLGGGLEPYRERFAVRAYEGSPPEDPHGPIEGFVAAVNHPAAGAREVARFLDARLFLRELAAEAFLADWDGLVGEFGMNNFYLHRNRRTGTFRFLPWDKDNTFKANDYPVWPEGMDANALTRQLVGDPALRTYFLDVLLECAAAAESRVRAGDMAGAPQQGWLAREIELEYRQIAEAARADGRKAPSNRLFEEAVDGLRDFARFRPAFVRAYVAAHR